MARMFRRLLMIFPLVVVGVFLHGTASTADAPNIDPYPWINTFYFNNLKNPHSFTTDDAHFIADHYDEASAHLWYINDRIHEWNQHIKIFQFGGPAGFSAWDQEVFAQFLTLHPEYTQREIEDAYIHYQCDVTYNGILYPGCNLTNPDTGACSGQPATGCTASTATQLSQSRVPDPAYVYQMLGWLLADYTSQVWRDYGIWSVEQSDALFGSTNHPEGLWWDNILYLGSHEIGKTIEYWGQPDNGSDHQRDLDYHDYFLSVKTAVEQDLGRSLLWLGNVNNMYWVRSDGPYTQWVLDTLRYASPESWVSPINFGEYAMPAWGLDCHDIKNAWDYTVNHNLQLSVLTYNNPFDSAYPNPDQRTKTFSIAKYYLANNPNLYYGYREDGVGNNVPATQWNRMAEVNIGNPRTNPAGVRDFLGSTGTNLFFDWNNQGTQLNCTYFTWENAVFARHFDNGLVIARWKGQRWQSGTPPVNDPAFNSYIDPQSYALANPFHDLYYPVQPDGTIPYEPISSITLRTNEAAVLLQACDAGIVTATCGCNGVILESGAMCVPNVPPTIADVDDQTMNEGETRQIQVRASDPDCPDGSCLTFTVTGMSLQSFASIQNHGDGTATLFLAPDFSDDGTSQFTVHVTDTGQPPASDVSVFTVTVANASHPPTLLPIPDQSIHEGDALAVTVAATDPNSEDHLTLTAANLPGGSAFADQGNRTGLFTWVPTTEQAGSYPGISITVTDVDGNTDTKTFTITVLDGLSGCSPVWQCTDWTICVDGARTRVCTDGNSCGTDADQPAQVDACDSVPPAQVTDLSTS